MKTHRIEKRDVCLGIQRQHAKYFADPGSWVGHHRDQHGGPVQPSSCCFGMQNTIDVCRVIHTRIYESEAIPAVIRGIYEAREGRLAWMTGWPEQTLDAHGHICIPFGSAIDLYHLTRRTRRFLSGLW